MKYLFLLFLTACSNMPKATDADPQHAVLGLVAEKQKNTQWCAAAAARMMMSLKTKNLPSQCEIVEKTLKRSCINTNVYTEDALRAYGYNAKRVAPNFDLVVSEIKADRPVTIYHKTSAGTASEGGHAVVAYGTFNQKGRDYIVVYDPFYGRVETWDSSYLKGNLEWYGLVVML